MVAPKSRRGSAALAVRVAQLPLLILTIASATSVPASASDPIAPLTHAHAHNDYEHERPLLDALDQGFCSVEADVFLVDGHLLVGHSPDQLRADRTLERLYLDPLLSRSQVGKGRIYENGPSILLLIDFKSEAESTYKALEKALEPYREMLVSYRGNQRIDGAVEIILSGDRPIETVAQQQRRWVSIDGRMKDLENPQSVSFMPLVSDNWNTHFRWQGQGPLPNDEAEKLKAMVAKAHDQGRRVRFWAIPDQPTAWQIMSDHGVDLINTDDLPGLAKFLR